MQHTRALRLLLVLAAVFACAAVVVLASGANRPLFESVNAAGARWLPPAAPSCLTLLGNGLAAVMLLALVLERAPQVMAAGLYAAPIAGALSHLGKRVFATARPAAVMDPAGFHVQGPLLAGHNAFPSGHTITIFLVATVLLLGLDAPRARWPLAVLVLATATLVGLSRIMVGAHWPTDVLGGAALGIAAGAAGDGLARRWPCWRDRRVVAGFALAVVACAAALAGLDSGYPLATPLQWTLAAVGAIAALRTLVRMARAGRAPGGAP